MSGRRAWCLAVVVLAGILLSACEVGGGGSGNGGRDDEAAARRALDHAKATVDPLLTSVVKEAAQAFDGQPESAGGRYDSCSGELAGGVRYTGEFTFQAYHPTKRQMVAYAKRLEAQGWSVERPFEDAGFSARRDGLLLDLSFAPLGGGGSAETECVETSASLSKEYYKRTWDHLR